MNAYNESYLNDAMVNFGGMVEYAVCDLKMDPDEFMNYFISSGIATQFESGNPKYVVGKSGPEIAYDIMVRMNNVDVIIEPTFRKSRGREYWAGWILAYYQWFTGKRFCDIIDDGLSLSTIFSMYILHEADVSKFVESANAIIERNLSERPSKLSVYRKRRGFTQAKLSEVSDVSLRMIQLYEQKQNDISKASADVVLRLSKALCCDVEDLM